MFHFRSMEWSDEHDVLFLREMFSAFSHNYFLLMILHLCIKSTINIVVIVVVVVVVVVVSQECVWSKERSPTRGLTCSSKQHTQSL